MCLAGFHKAMGRTFLRGIYVKKCKRILKFISKNGHFHVIFGKNEAVIVISITFVDKFFQG